MSIMELRTAQAVKKHAGLKLRGIGITDPENFEPHLLDWSKLNAAQRSVGDISRGIIDKMEGADETEERSLSEAHDLAHRAEVLLIQTVPRLSRAVVHAYPGHPPE